MNSILYKVYQMNALLLQVVTYLLNCFLLQNVAKGGEPTQVTKTHNSCTILWNGRMKKNWIKNEISSKIIRIIKMTDSSLNPKVAESR